MGRVCCIDSSLFSLENRSRPVSVPSMVDVVSQAESCRAGANETRIPLPLGDGAD